MVRNNRGAHQHLMRETQGGALPFRPAPRTRSEDSFSEFHYDITHLCPAGVPSSRIHHHHPKRASGKAQRSVMHQVMAHSPTENYLENMTLSLMAAEKIDGPRVDPSTKHISAGDCTEKTRSKVTLLAKHDLGDPTKVYDKADKSFEPKRARGYILDIQRKARTVCSPVNRNPLEVPAQPYRFQKRNAYGHMACGQTWSWNNCAETTIHSPFEILQGLRPWEMKMHTSPKGEKRYNVCGVEDMLPAGTNTFTKGDAPPSAWHVYENDKKYLSAFERGTSPKAGGGSQYLMESSDMWSCMTGHERSMDQTRARRCAPGQSFEDVPSYYSEGGSQLSQRSPRQFIARSQSYDDQRFPASPPSLASLRSRGSLSARSLQPQQAELAERPKWK